MAERKTLEEVRKLPWQQQLNYFARDNDLYNQEMNRIDNVLSSNPNHLAGWRWKDQVRTAREQYNPYSKYDYTTQSQVTTLKPTVRPDYSNQIASLINTLQSNIMNQQNIDVTKDPRYQAQMELMRRNVSDAQRQTMEEMNARGLLMSDMTNDRLAQIEQQGMSNLNALIPLLYQTISSENQQQLSNLATLLNTIQSEDQRQFSNELNLRQQAFNEGLQMRNYNLAVDQWIANKDLAERQLQLQEESNRIQQALNTVNTIGYVPDETTAQLLGVPVGTESFAAREAAANRALQLQMHKASLAAQERSEKSIKLNQLISLWQVSGAAPPGLEEFGIQPGQPLSQTPTEQLESLIAMQEIANQQQQQAMQEALPDIQARFGVDSITAQAIYKVWENPTLESAMADYNATLKQMRDAGIDINAVEAAIQEKFSNPVDAISGAAPMVNPSNINNQALMGSIPSNWSRSLNNTVGNLRATNNPSSGGNRSVNLQEFIRMMRNR